MPRPRLSWIVPFVLALMVAGGVSFAPPTHAEDEGKDGKPAEAKIDPALFALGGISAADLWTTYMVVGAVGDHFYKGGYDADQVKTVLDARISFNTKAIDLLQKVAAQPDLDPSEIEHIESVKAAYTALTAYANALLEYRLDKSKANAADYQAKRKAAWEPVKSVLGIK